MRIVAFSLVLATVGLSASSARAQAHDKAAAEIAFVAGRELMDEGRHEEACRKFELSYRLDPAIGTLLNIANCHETIGKTASAWAEFTEVADRAGQDRRGQEARRRADLLKPRLTLLLLSVAGPPPDGLVVMQNGQDVTLLLGTAVPVDLGEYAISAAAPGRTTWSTTVAAAAEGVTIHVEIPELVPTADPLIEPSTDKSPTESGAAPVSVLDDEPRHAVVRSDRLDVARPSRSLRTAGAVSLAVGALAIGTSAYFGIRASTLSDRVSGAPVFDEAVQRDYRDGERAERTMYAAVAAAAVATTAGAVLLILDGRRAGAERSRRAVVVPAISPTLAGVLARAHF